MVKDLKLDVSAFPKELHLLLAFIRIDPAPDTLQEQLRGMADIHWGRFIELVRHHRVYPLMYTNLKKLNTGFIPPHVMRTLYMDYSRNTFQMLHLSSEAVNLCKVLDEHRIRTLLLKGPVLAEELYGDISLRTSKDLDILIPADEVEKADKILNESGYEVINDVPDGFGIWKSNEREHHLSYIHPLTKVQIELHWRLNPETELEPSFGQLWERRRTNTLASNPVHMLGNEDLYFYLISHGARHGWFRLRWLADIDRLARQPLDWNQITYLLKRYCCTAIGGQTIILVSELFRTPVKQEIKTLASGREPLKMAQTAADFIKEMDKPDATSITFIRYLLKFKTKRERMFFFINLLYPTSQDAKMLPLPKFLHFLYFPLRPVLWFWRRTKQQAQS